ncbi:phage integrase central domain-containing protein [Magnetococcus marinus]|uniref:phage integrase central domain-containing protein n=1 Tax=Magnetococcus marinus TaxID=1124597 RepID=UPI00003C5593|nr:hypothetical protein [Magnetococcus marinus]
MESDPGEHRKATKAAKIAAEAGSFETVTLEWYARHLPNWTDMHSTRLLRLFQRDIFPWIGNRPIADITPPELLSMLRRIEKEAGLDGEPQAGGGVGGMLTVCGVGAARLAHWPNILQPLMIAVNVMGQRAAHPGPSADRASQWAKPGQGAAHQNALNNIPLHPDGPNGPGVSPPPTMWKLPRYFPGRPYAGSVRPRHAASVPLAHRGFRFLGLDNLNPLLVIVDMLN